MDNEELRTANAELKETLDQLREWCANLTRAARANADGSTCHTQRHIRDVYFWNRVTNETVWERPVADPPAQQRGAAAATLPVEAAQPVLAGRRLSRLGVRPFEVQFEPDGPMV